MALYTNGGATPSNVIRSHTNLIKSPGDSPVGQWIIDNNLKGLFSYPYAVGRRLSKVVVPKGTIVAVKGRAKDYLTGKYRNIITVADGANNNAVGVAPYNYFNRFDTDGNVYHDMFGADDFQPAIITREYIEVPYIANPEDVYGDGVSESGVVTITGSGMPTMGKLKMMWGCATNVSKGDISTANELAAGDYVKAGPCGKFVRWNSPNDSAHLIVGQCLELDTDMPPLGWLQYVEQVYEGRNSDREPFTPEPAPADGGPIYDPDYTYPYTSDYMRPNAEHSAWKTIGNGQPGLTDGKNAAKTVRIQKFTLAVGETTVNCPLDPVAKVDPESITVTLNGNEVDKATEIPATPTEPYYTYDPATQILTVVSDEAATPTAETVVVTYKVDPKSLVGMPASWDYLGSVGVARILLKF
jgi:hypothetical protein